MCQNINIQAKSSSTRYETSSLCVLFNFQGIAVYLNGLILMLKVPETSTKRITGLDRVTIFPRAKCQICTKMICVSQKTPEQEFTLTYDQFRHITLANIENDEYVFGTLPERLTTWLVVCGQTVMFHS